MTSCRRVEMDADAKRARGYPLDKPLKVGKMTIAEITAGVNNKGLVSSKKTANNELTLTYDDGTVVCRLRETNIVTIFPDGMILIDTGGWNTVTTKRHIMDFLNARGFQILTRGDKKGGGIRITWGDNIPAPGILFNRQVILDSGGGYFSDMGVTNGVRTLR